MRIAFVVPRYGPRIVGGAETLARRFAEHLPPDRFEVDVLTTCAVDHHRWTNALPAGEERDGAVTIRRFPVSPRNVGEFLAVQERISARLAVGLDEELAWVAGSVNSEDLYGYLETEHERYEALVFLPYLFGTTLIGSQVDRRRSVLIPCLHDEPFAYTRVVGHLFRSVQGVLFNSAPERSLARRLFGVAADAPVVGLGFDEPGTAADVEGFRSRHGIDGEYLLYFGRKEEGKNLPLLLDHFAACAGRGLSLVVAGDGSIDPSRRFPGVVDLPRLEEEDKRAACAGALAVCQPSTNESFSIVLMEAWLEGTPVLVNGRCAVTRHHVRRAGGGLYFTSREEFAAEVEWLRDNGDQAREMGRAGRQFVGERYSWGRVIERFEAGLRGVLDGNG
ncbi:MAG: glycosyltransferase family 4 protein [Candidatus Binatia bacterium]